MLHSGGVGLLCREKGNRGFLHFGREVHVYVYLSCLSLICLLWCLGMALGIVHGFLHAFHEFLKVLGKQEYLVLLTCGFSSSLETIFLLSVMLRYFSPRLFSLTST